MTIQTKKQVMQIEEGRTKLTVQHNGEDLIFTHPFHGSGTYVDVQEKIESAGLITPTMSEVVSLAYAAFEDADNPYSKEVRTLMKNRWLWGFTGNLYLPNDGQEVSNGVIIQDSPEIRDGMPFMDRNDLVKKLEANDSSVRFVPFGFETEAMSPLQLGKNSYIQGLVGEESADKLAEMADKFRGNPYLWSWDSVDSPITRVSALDSHRNLAEPGLGVLGDFHGYGTVGCASGVLRAGEASRIRK